MSLTSWFRNISIRRKLIVISFFSITAATLLAILLSTLMQWSMLREDLIKNVSAQASIIAASSANELASNDREAAQKIVAVVVNINNIEFAGILDKKGNNFALYLRPGVTIAAHSHQGEKGASQIQNAAYIEISLPVLLDQEQIGRIHVRSDMNPVYHKLKLNILIIVVSAAGAFLLVVLMLMRLLPVITKPLQDLVGLMEIVSRDNNFTLRAKLSGTVEIDMLAKGFNAMLAQLQIFDNAFIQNSQHLEDEVAQGTEQFLESDTQLEKELVEHKLGKQKLKNVNEQLSALLNSLPIAVYRSRAEGDFAMIYMSPNVLSFTDYEPKDFIEQSDLWLTRLHPDDAEKMTSEMELLFEKEAHVYEYRWMRADGTYIWIQDSLRIIPEEDGIPLHLAGMWQDITTRKKVEEQLRKREFAYRTLTQNLPGIVYRLFVDEGHRMEFYNEMVLQTTGYRADELTDSSIKPLILDEDRPAVMAKVMLAVKEQCPFTVEYRLKHKNGTICWMVEYGMPVYEDRNVLLYIDGLIFDITDRKVAEEDSHKQQELTNLIIEAIPMRVFWKDQNLRFLGCNTLFAKDAGYIKPEELIGKNDFDMAWKDQADLYHSDDRQVVDSGTPKLSFDEPQTTPDGRQIWLRTSKVPLHNDAHQSIGILGIYEMITEYKQLELKLRESEERFRNVTELTSDWVWQIDQNGIYVYSGGKSRDLLGYEPEEVYGNTLFDFMSPEEGARVGAIFKKLTCEQKPFSFMENTILHKDGHQVILETSGVPLFSDDGIFQGFFGTEHDITERKQAKEALEESEYKFRTILDVAADGVCLVDKQTRKFIQGNNAICKMLGYRDDELYELGIEDIHPAEALAEVFLQFNKKRQGEIIVVPNIPVKRKNGSIFLADISSAAIILDGRTIMVGFFHDVTERKKVEEEIKLLATTDSLTGIANRRAFSTHLASELERSNRYGTPLSLVMFDIDYFKKVNDNFGHDAGDDVLQALSELVKRNIRAVDIVARWGGEEFMLLMPESDISAATAAIEKLRREISDFPFGQVGSLTVSFGITVFVLNEDSKVFLKRVDDALYQAKEKGRNRVEIL
ncbi:diguanylate cyclase with PAS/PAC sensor [Psychromonas ingrahamii 37]|uniref:Diguanylate cyclase with PAS/PAC sensor n=1 Tax=Psychromonas ingrahamii (strain DSM 17664 / CCUG 51855 / 37) TaxID=357804 RepID=A1SRM4_PSYIN|nr:PAS domain S-box protein [Psychromonas ingrahamii]ABM02139.1 diguanylate cyclase with PAS/PAC sensor [Psychromonas ingrahamii 37]